MIAGGPNERQPLPAWLLDLGYGVRARAWWLARGTARTVRPVLGRAAFEALYGLGRVGYVPRTDTPRTFVEKLLWLKRHYRHPLMPTLADKLAARAYVAATAPELRLCEVYSESETVDGFSFAALPARAVIKAAHGSGLVAFWERGADEAALRPTLAAWLARRHVDHLEEWFYASIKPRVFAEEDLRDAAGAIPADYKVFVLNGRAEQVQVFSDRHARLTRTTFDRAWRLLPDWRSTAPGGRPIVVDERSAQPRPERLDELLGIAERLAAPFPFVRVDLYVIGALLYFGEMTFMPAGGYVPLPRERDEALGAILTLPPATGRPERP